MGKKLTERQREILQFIIDDIATRGYPPSIREIGKQFGIGSLRGVTVHLDALERKGWIERERTSRSIKVLAPIPEERDGSASVPLVGSISAGTPILAIENISGYIPVPPEMVARVKGAFALQVKGDSMIGDHIVDGDLVVISPQKTAENGTVVAVLLEDEATVKRIYFEQGKARLVASNPNYAPIEVSLENSMILGKVVGLLRSY